MIMIGNSDIPGQKEVLLYHNLVNKSFLVDLLVILVVVILVPIANLDILMNQEYAKVITI